MVKCKFFNFIFPLKSLARILRTQDEIKTKQNYAWSLKLKNNLLINKPCDGFKVSCIKFTRLGHSKYFKGLSFLHFKKCLAIVLHWLTHHYFQFWHWMKFVVKKKNLTLNKICFALHLRTFIFLQLASLNNQ
jgi:hypothetical protein